MTMHVPYHKDDISKALVDLSKSYVCICSLRIFGFAGLTVLHLSNPAICICRQVISTLLLEQLWISPKTSFVFNKSNHLRFHSGDIHICRSLLYSSLSKTGKSKGPSVQMGVVQIGLTPEWRWWWQWHVREEFQNQRKYWGHYTPRDIISNITSSPTNYSPDLFWKPSPKLYLKISEKALESQTLVWFDMMFMMVMVMVMVMMMVIMKRMKVWHKYRV